MELATYALGLATLGSINVKLDKLAGGVAANDLGVELELDTLFLEDSLGSLGDLSVHAGSSDLAEELNNGDLGSQSRPNRSHLKTNDTTANDSHGLGDLLQRNGTGAGDDALLIDLEAGEGGGLGAGGDEDVLAAEDGLAAVVELDLDLVLVDEGAGTLDILGTVLLEQELDALGQAGDGGLLCLHEVLEVELDLTDLDTAVF